MGSRAGTVWVQALSKSSTWVGSIFSNITNILRIISDIACIVGESLEIPFLLHSKSTKATIMGMIIGKISGNRAFTVNSTNFWRSWSACVNDVCSLLRSSGFYKKIIISNVYNRYPQMCILTWAGDLGQSRLNSSAFKRRLECAAIPPCSWLIITSVYLRRMILFPNDTSSAKSHKIVFAIFSLHIFFWGGSSNRKNVNMQSNVRSISS